MSSNSKFINGSISWDFGLADNIFEAPWDWNLVSRKNIDHCYRSPRFICCRKNKLKQNTWPSYFFLLHGINALGRKARPCKERKKSFQLIKTCGKGVILLSTVVPAGKILKNEMNTWDSEKWDLTYIKRYLTVFWPAYCVDSASWLLTYIGN